MAATLPRPTATGAFSATDGTVDDPLTPPITDTDTNPDGIASTSGQPSITWTIGSNGVSSTPVSIAEPQLATTTPEYITTNNASKLNQAALIGICVGGGVLLLLVFLLALFIILRRRKRRRTIVEEPSSEDEQVHPKQSSHSRGPSYEQMQQRRSTGDGPLYHPVSTGAQEPNLLQAPTLLHEKEASSETTSPNLRNSLTLENEPTSAVEEPKENTPLDPFSSGYIPPPSPTPSEYVIVEHTTPEPSMLPPRTSRDKRESRSSLLDMMVPEEGGKDFSTLGSVTSGRPSTVATGGHRRTMSGEASANGTYKRTSNRLQKPRPSIDSTSSIFLRATSPFQFQRSTSPITFPKGDPFEASLEEEETLAPLRPSLDRPSMDRPNRSSASYETRKIDGLPETVSSRPSMDTIAAGGTEKTTSPQRKKHTHVRSPSSPTRVVPNSPSFLNLGKKASASVLSLQHQHEYTVPNAPYLNMNSPTMADASVYDFDIYRQPNSTPPPPLPDSAAVASSHPPRASAAFFNKVEGGDPYGSTGSKKRFSASMSDLPNMSSPPPGGKSRFSASMSTNQVNLHGKESMDDSVLPPKRTIEPSVTNIYIPKESLDLPR